MPTKRRRSLRATVSFDHHHTLMTIDHVLLPPELVEQHQRGWTAIAEQIDAALSRPIGGTTQPRELGHGRRGFRGRTAQIASMCAL